jgi:hypothetical protein
MPEIGEPEEWASSGFSEHAVPISATKQAIEALENDPELSLSKAAKMFHICRQTLTNRLRGRNQNRQDTAISQQRLTPAEENDLEDMALQLYSWGHLLIFRGLQMYASEILIAKGDCEPLGQKWHTRFFARHLDLKASLSRFLELARHIAANPITYDNHFARFKATREKYNIADGDT